MGKQRTRKVKLSSSPEVTHSTYNGPYVTVVVTGRMGSTRIIATGELSPWCAQQLIVDLRKALRGIRADQVALMDSAIRNAEQPL
jgi:hypothetical protein